MSMLFKFRPLVVNPELAVRVGLNEAIVLQQLNYWIVDREAGVEHDGKRWVYNTLEQWRKQFPFWSVETVKRTLSSLHKEGLIHVEQLNKRQHDRTNFYTINFKHKHLIDEAKTAPIEEVNLTRSSRAECPSLHTEITTETTSQSIGADAPAGDENESLKSPARQAKPSCPIKAITDLFNDTLQELPAVVLINKGREANLKARWSESPVHQSLDFWRDYFEMVKTSDFLMGRAAGRNGGKPFRATFDWLIAPSNFVKVVEGNYHA